MNGVETITARILGEAESAALSAKEEGKRQVADILDSYRSRADYLLAAARDDAGKEEKAAELRSASGASMARRRILLEAKAEAVASCYEAAAEYFRSLPAGEYRSFLFSLLYHALKQKEENDAYLRRAYGEEEVPPCDAYVVVLSGEDREKVGASFLSDFAAEYAGRLPEETLKKLRLSDRPEKTEGGLILRCGEIETNCTLPVLLASEREKSEARVSDLLFSDTKE